MFLDTVKRRVGVIQYSCAHMFNMRIKETKNDIIKTLKKTNDYNLLSNWKV